MAIDCYLNGEFMPHSAAKVSVMDRGFLFGDGVYEVVPTYGRRLFCWQRHLRRLARSLGEIYLADSLNVESLTAPAEKLIQQFDDADAMLYIQITRGVATARRHNLPQPPPPPTVFMLAMQRAAVAADKIRYGVSCRTAAETRWLRADIKSISLLGAVLAAQQAAENNNEEVILIRDGMAGEAAACNIFIVADGEIITPPADNRILAGISREITLEVARQSGFTVTVRDIPVAELVAADEIWLTSSTREVLPVTMLDGNKVGDGMPGKVFAVVAAAFRSFVESGSE